jgi:hypothetical protein
MKRTGTGMSQKSDKRERAKRAPKTPQTVEVSYRIYSPPVTRQALSNKYDEEQVPDLGDDEEHKGEKEGEEEEHEHGNPE